MVLWALIVPALLGLAAIVIDLGSARFTQSMMQSASDVAALEGLREQNQNAPNRQRAADIVAFCFDDDLNPANGDAVGYGAGAVYGLSGGIGPTELNASQQLSIDSNNRVYKPSLALNEENYPHGDMVAGKMISSSSRTNRDEESGYSRRDGFTPTPPGVPSDSFLVRLRRTSERDTLARDPGISTSGPAIPYLFGRGTTMSTGPTGYNPRSDGITVRSTSIARLVPAKTVGPIDQQYQLEGLVPVSLTASFWKGMGTDPVDLTIDSSGKLFNNQSQAGQVIDPSRYITIGQRISDRTRPAISTLTDEQRQRSVFVSLSESIDGQEWVIGFGLIEIVQTNPLQIRRRNGGNRFPPDGREYAGNVLRNVSARLIQTTGNALPSTAPLAEIMDRHHKLATNQDTSSLIILAPVLVR